MLVCCAAVPHGPEEMPFNCITRCGMLAKTDDCKGLREIETRTLAALKKHVGWDKKWACDQLPGWKVHLKPLTFYSVLKGCGLVSWWAPEKGYCVLGFAWRDRKLIELSTFEWRNQNCAIAHEIAHAIQFQTEYVGEHCGWEKLGVKAALLEVTGYADLTPEKCPMSPDGGTQ